ncbi:hypothetical protein HPB47_014840, partial [Ixodes persulcatus]
GGSKDVCGSCSAPFYGRQQYLACSGPCKRRFHCKCINVVEEDYELLMVDGRSSYKCPSCAKRLDETGNKVSDDSVAISPHEQEPSADAVMDGTDAHLLELVVLLCKKIDDLTNVVKTLKVDNESMRLQLSRNSELLRKLCLSGELTPAPSVSSKNFVTALKKPVPSATALKTPVPSSSCHDGSGDGNCASVRPSTAAVADGAANSEHSRTGPVDDEGFITVTRRKRPQPTEGKNTTCKLASVPRPPRLRALFVSRLNPSTTVSDISGVVAATLKGKVWDTQFWRCDRWSTFQGRCQAACWSPDGAQLLCAFSNSPALYAVSFPKPLNPCLGDEEEDSAWIPHSSAGSGSGLPVVDLAEVTLSALSGHSGNIKVGGTVQNMAWDKHGERLAVSFRDHGQYVALFCTRTYPMLEVSP